MLRSSNPANASLSLLSILTSQYDYKLGIGYEVIELFTSCMVFIACVVSVDLLDYFQPSSGMDV
jgi:hypothetical protein